jgi:hypothetical protein
MPDRNEQERLLIHDTVATTVDTIVAAIQQEIRIEEAVSDDTFTRAELAKHQGIIEGLRAAAGFAAIASVAARAAAMHTERDGQAAA